MPDQPNPSRFDRIDFYSSADTTHPLTAIVRDPPDSDGKAIVIFYPYNNWHETPLFDSVKWTGSRWQSIHPPSTARRPAIHPHFNQYVARLLSTLGHPPKPKRRAPTTGGQTRTPRRSFGRRR